MEHFGGQKQKDTKKNQNLNAKTRTKNIKIHTHTANTQTQSDNKGESRRYACEYCDKTYASNHSLKQHSYTHFGLKPHKCSYCEKRYTQPNNLRTHFRKFHPNGIWKLPAHCIVP